MKVFISWSGDKSQKIALVFRDWLPSVIQSIEPYVSSEDINKGARWSTDIAKELENSTFGILCVTRDNLVAPWLSFEAGALSKTMDKTFVSPFLFDIKRSEVDGPLLQFQSTIFEKEDIKKLLHTLNRACTDKAITETMLERAFEVWYPTLEEQLNKIKLESEEKVEKSKEKSPNPHNSSEMLEEILNLSRDNQKLLRNPDLRTNDFEIKQYIDSLLSQFDNNYLFEAKRPSKKSTYFYLDSIINSASNVNPSFKYLIILSFIRDDIPWIYDVGKAVLEIVQSNSSFEKKFNAIDEFETIIEKFARENINLRNEQLFNKHIVTSLIKILKSIVVDVDDYKRKDPHKIVDENLV